MKKAIITGITGQDGSYLAKLLLSKDYKVYGAQRRNTGKRYWRLDELGITDQIEFVDIDLGEPYNIEKVLDKIQPDEFYNLAAQSFVGLSFEQPQVTTITNSLGVLNILEVIRKNSFVIAGVIITSDKCYQNKEFKRGYKENDQLAGIDPYSASKSSAEIISHSYFNSFFSLRNVATARAGNVIGGGDWSPDRIVPDYFRAVIKKKKLIIRNPKSTRPWQHVLEPLGGYLLLGKNLINKNKKVLNNSFNFGPIGDLKSKTVLDLVKNMSKKNFYKVIKKNNLYESKLLQLNCTKVEKKLNWMPVLNFKETINFTKSWYERYINKSDMYEFSKYQILENIKIAKKKNINWIK